MTPKQDDRSIADLIADAPDDQPISDDPLVVRLACIVARQQTEIEQLREILTAAGIEVEQIKGGTMRWRKVQ